IQCGPTTARYAEHVTMREARRATVSSFAPMLSWNSFLLSMVFLVPLIRTTPATTSATTFLECDLAHIHLRRNVRSTRVGAYRCNCSGLSKGTIASRRCIRLLQVQLSGKSQRRVLVRASLQDVGGVEI